MLDKFARDKPFGKAIYSTTFLEYWEAQVIHHSFISLWKSSYWKLNLKLLNTRDGFKNLKISGLNPSLVKPSFEILRADIKKPDVKEQTYIWSLRIIKMAKCC